MLHSSVRNKCCTQCPIITWESLHGLREEPRDRNSNVSNLDHFNGHLVREGRTIRSLPVAPLPLSTWCDGIALFVSLSRQSCSRMFERVHCSRSLTCSLDRLSNDYRTIALLTQTIVRMAMNVSTCLTHYCCQSALNRHLQTDRKLTMMIILTHTT